MHCLNTELLDFVFILVFLLFLGTECLLCFPYVRILLSKEILALINLDLLSHTKKKKVGAVMTVILILLCKVKKSPNLFCLF